MGNLMFLMDRKTMHRGKDASKTLLLFLTTPIPSQKVARPCVFVAHLEKGVLSERVILATRRAASLNGNNPNKKLVQRGQLIREKEQKLMSKPKQLMNPSVSVVSTSLISHDSIISKCGNRARRRRECYVEDARIRNTGRKKKLRCILCTVGNRVCII